MHENIIIGAIIGFLWGVCIARGWWLGLHRTRPQARRVVMQEVVLPEVAPLQMRDGQLQLRVITQAMPPIVRMQARQPFFLLDRSQVHQLRDMLSSADDQLRELYRAANLPVDQTNDTTESSLDEKVRFVKRLVSFPYPAILSLTHLTVELTQAELMILMVRVFSHSTDIEYEDADGFYAEDPLGQELRHLMQSGKHDRQGPSLCGSLPKPEPGVMRESWWLFAFQGEPEQKHVCPVCISVWRTLATSQKQPLQVTKALPDDSSSQDLARYDV